MCDLHDYFTGAYFVWWIACLMVLIFIFVRFGYKHKKNDCRQRPKESSLEILKKRYTKGEMSKEAYAEAKETLEAD